MSEPDGSRTPTPVPNPIDSAPAAPSELGPSAPAVQTLGAQEPLPTGVTPQASAAQPERTVFGLKQDANHYYYQPPQNIVFNDDYDKRLPEDPYCRETAPNARIWRVYNEEAATFDTVFVGQARDGLDVMLVFAGLFSAVVTSFLVQVSQSLQADYTAMSAILLYDLVSVQLSIADGPSSRPNISVPSINPLQTFRPDSITVWVNGLWVTSLTMSLVVALSAVLVKQWLHHYTSIPSGTPGERSHLRQYRFDGLQKWRLNVIIGIFPVVMHTSLALFLVGLMLFFTPLRTSIACAVGVITVALCLLYLVSSALPIFFPQCPYQTPLTDFMYYTSLASKHLFPAMFGYLRWFVATCQDQVHHFIYRGTQSNSGLCPATGEALSVMTDPHKGSSAKLSVLEMKEIKSNYDTLSVDALDWLFNISTNPTVQSLVIQSIGGLPSDVKAYAESTWQGQSEIQSAQERLLEQFDVHQSAHWMETESKNAVERISRSFCFVPSRMGPTLYFDGIPDEPRLAAVCLMSLTAEYEPQDYDDNELQKFLCTHCDVELHPLVWVNLLQAAITARLCGLHHYFDGTKYPSSQEDAHFFSLLLPLGEVHHDNEWDRPDPHRMILYEALISYSVDISESVLRLLNTLLPTVNDDLPPILPSHYQILYKLGKYAQLNITAELRALDTASDVGNCRHLQLLTSVLDMLAREYKTILEAYPSFLTPIFHFLCTTIENTPICDYNTAGWQDQRLKHMLDRSLSPIIRLSCQFFMSRQPEFVFPSFHRLLQVNVYSLRSLEDTFPLMEHALAVGNEAMYRAFIDGEWLWNLSELYFHCQSSEYVKPICAFIRGLDSVSSAASAMEFLEYSQEPRHFFIFFIICSIETDSEALLKLCPQNSPWWGIHRATLYSLINWCHTPNRDDLPFPLDNLFEGTFIRMGAQAMPLDEVVRERFTLGSDWRLFAWAARTIVLGEAAPDPPRQEFIIEVTPLLQTFRYTHL